MQVVCITFSLATICRVAQEHEEAQLRRMKELEERLAADRRDRLTVGHDRRRVQGGPHCHAIGLVDLDLGGSHGSWAASVDAIFPCRIMEHPNFQSMQPKYLSR